MSSLEQGMLAFLITTLLFMTTTATLFRKLNQVQKHLRQLEETGIQSQSHENGRQHTK